MIDTDIHARLLALDAHLTKADGQLQSKAQSSSAHSITNRELCDRYYALIAQVAQEETDEASLGHHVSALEHSVKMWMARLSNGTK